MINAGGNKRYRQRRRRRHERVGDQVNVGADGAIIVFVATLRRSEGLRDVRVPAANRRRRIHAADAVEMNVPKRHSKLNRQREERQPARKPAAVTQPVRRCDHRHCIGQYAGIARV